MYLAVDVLVVIIGAKVLYAFSTGQKVRISESELQRLVLYAGTGVYAGQVLSNLMSASWPNILSVYSLYLFWLGFSYLGILSPEKKGGFVAVSAMLLGATMLLTFMFFNYIVSLIVF